MNKLTQIFLASSIVLGATQAVQAAVVSVSASSADCAKGVLTPQNVPATIGMAAGNANCAVRVFNEAQGATLNSTLLNDPLGLPLGSGVLTLGGAAITSGTQVDSHLVNFQPSALLGQSVNGSVTFSQNILAVVYSNFGLAANQGFSNTAYLQNPSTGYAYGQLFGAETALLDGFSFTGNTLNFNLSSSSLLGGDNLRVITDVPAPASLALVLAGAFGLMAVRRKIQTRLMR
jgi:hypothetical protein